MQHSFQWVRVGNVGIHYDEVTRRLSANIGIDDGVIKIGAGQLHPVRAYALNQANIWRCGGVNCRWISGRVVSRDDLPAAGNVGGVSDTSRGSRRNINDESNHRIASAR